MSDIATKLTYLNTTKSQLKDQINYGLPTEKQITSSTTFREYVSSIFEAFLEALRNPDTLFTNLPKTSASGSQITLNGTAYAPMRITLNPTAISQTTYTGKNLFDTYTYRTTNALTYITFNKNGSLTFNGTPTSTNITLTISSFSLEAGTYYFSSNIEDLAGTDTGIRLWLKKASDNSTITNSYYGYESNSFTLTETTNMYMTIAGTNLTSKTYNNVVLKPMISISSNTSWEPYVGGTASPNPSYPQDIHTISGNNSVVVEGKNFARVDDTNISATGYTLTTSKGLITITTTGTNNSFDLCKGIRTGTYLPNYANANDYHLTPANQGTYKLSISNTIANITESANQIIEIFTNQRLIMSYINTAGTLLGTTSFTLEPNEYVKSIYMWTNGGTTINKLQFNMQLELGSTATPYEPYVSQTYPINLPVENLWDEETTLGFYNDSGVWTERNDILSSKNPIYLNPSESYYFNSPTQAFYTQWTSNGTFISRTNLPRGNGVLNLDSNCAYILFNLLTNYGTTYKNDIMINKGTTPQTYTPYGTTPIELGTIGDYKNEFVRSGGEQLFDISTITENKYISSNNGTISNSSVSNVSDYIEVKSGESYYLTYNYGSLLNSDSRGLCYFDNSKTYIRGISYNPTTKAYLLNIPSNVKYIRFAYDKNCYDIMLNKGTTALPYVPYEKGWYYKQGIGKATNNTISSGSSYSNIIYFSLPKPVDSLNYIWATRNTQFMYSKAQYSTSGNWNSADNIGKIVGGASEHTFWVGFPVGTTLAQAQELLANDTLYYILATPTYTKITGELANQLEQVNRGMLSYDGTTNISQVNNDLAFELVGSAITK